MVVVMETVVRVVVEVVWPVSRNAILFMTLIHVFILPSS